MMHWELLPWCQHFNDHSFLRPWILHHVEPVAFLAPFWG